MRGIWCGVFLVAARAAPCYGYGMSKTSIVDSEAAHFGGLAGDWWDPDGASAMLHKLNPVRLAYIRDRIDQHWHLDECALRPLAGKTALDVGCGAGLLAEPLARGRMRRMVTPSSTNAWDTNRSARLRLSVCSALLAALAMTL